MKAHDSKETYPAIAVPPGDTLRDELEARNLSQAELARRMNRKPEKINDIITGKTALTPETALQLESVFGISAAFWLTREARYRQTLALIDRKEALEGEIKLLKLMPYKELSDLGKVKATRNSEEKVSEMRSFFGVATLTAVEEPKHVSLRVAQLSEKHRYTLCAWIRLGQIEAEKTVMPAFSEKKFEKALHEIRKKMAPGIVNIQHEIREILKEAGVVFALVPHLKSSYAQGCARWFGVKNDKALIQVSLRGSYEDILWFTLFHEAAHILYKHKTRTVFVSSTNNKYRKDSPEEREADSFASSFLINEEDYEHFLEEGHNSSVKIKAFAEKIGVPSGVVVGRLQHDGLIQRSQLNNLRTKLVLKA